VPEGINEILRGKTTPPRATELLATIVFGRDEFVNINEVNTMKDFAQATLHHGPC
jgi:hypothetical protein